MIKVNEIYLIPFYMKRMLINENGDILGLYFWDDYGNHLLYSGKCIIRDYGFTN